MAKKKKKSASSNTKRNIALVLLPLLLAAALYQFGFSGSASAPQNKPAAADVTETSVLGGVLKVEPRVVAPATPLPSSELNTKWKIFLKWVLDEVGAYMPYAIEVREKPLRGMYARERIPAGGNYVTVPASHVLGGAYLTAIGWIDTMNHLGITQSLHLQSTVFLLYERYENWENSTWQTYLDMFPEVPWSPMLYTQEELDIIKTDPFFWEYYTIRKRSTLAEFRLVRKTWRKNRHIFKKKRDLFLEEFLWSRENVRSRVFSIRDSITNESTYANMAPLADMFNHRIFIHPNDPNRLMSTSWWALTGDRFHIYTTIPIEPGEQLFTNYGFRDNINFLFNYGFVPGDVPLRFQVTYIKLEPDEDDPLRQQKLRGIRVCNSKVKLSNFNDQPSFAVMKAKFIPRHTFSKAVLIEETNPQLLNNSTWVGEVCDYNRDMLFNPQRSRQNQYAIQLIMKKLKQKLANYPPEEEDRARLQDPDSPQNLKNLLQIRLTDRKVIRSILSSYDDQSLLIKKLATWMMA